VCRRRADAGGAQTCRHAGGKHTRRRTQTRGEGADTRGGRRQTRGEGADTREGKVQKGGKVQKEGIRWVSLQAWMRETLMILLACMREFLISACERKDAHVCGCIYLFMHAFIFPAQRILIEFLLVL
jgi:hypothetical protein